MADEGQSFEDGFRQDFELLLGHHWRRLLKVAKSYVDEQLPEGEDPLDDEDTGHSAAGSS